jgi:predicted secreted protein
MTSISLLENQTIQIDLPGKGTAGYTWTYKMRPKGILQIIQKYLVPERGLAGGTAVERFSVTGLETGECRIDFKLSRSWENDKNPLDSRSYLITVLPAS